MAHDVPERPWSLPAERVTGQLDVDPSEGLRSDEVTRRREVHGRNELRKHETRSTLSILIEQFKSLIIGLLAVASAVAFFYGETLEGWARDQSIDFGSRHDLLTDPRILDFLQKEIYGEFGDLARYELPKKVGLIPEEFTVKGGALTPTEKVKRRVVEDRYEKLIDSFYLEENVEQTMFVTEPKKDGEETREVA